MPKYNFLKILRDFNKEYGTKYTIHHINIFQATIKYDKQTDRFGDIVFSTVQLPVVNMSSSIRSFIEQYITSAISSSVENCIKDFIRRKQKDSTKVEIKILPSNKIRYAYLYTNYFTTTGSLGNSCMRTKEMQKSLNFYVKNNVKIVVAIDGNNKIHARALLWEGVKSTDRKSAFTYLDRVYTKSDSIIPLFHTLAEENKWKYYSSTSAGKAKRTYYIDNINITDICHLPYTDTFRRLFYKDNIVAASTDNCIRKIITHDCYVSLTHTHDGGYAPEIDADRVRESLTGKFVSKKDAIKVKRYEGYVLKKNIVNIDGDYYSKHDGLISESQLDGFILTENSVNEVITNEIIDKTKAIFSPKHDGFIHKTHAVDIKNEIYHIDDADIICFSGKWYHISQCFVNFDREKRNTELAQKQYHFWVDSGVFTPYPGSLPTRQGDLIPKDCAIIAYNLVFSPILNTLEYQEVYLSNNVSKSDYLTLNNGVCIINSSKNKHYLKKFNGKWYIKQDFEPPNKNQLLLFGDKK